MTLNWELIIGISGLSIALLVFIWNIIIWWIGRSAIPFLTLQCAIHSDPTFGSYYCEIFVSVTNHGKRVLQLSEAEVWIVQGVHSEKSPKLAFFNPIYSELTKLASKSDIADIPHVRLEDIPQMTFQAGNVIEPDVTASEILTISVYEKTFYKIYFYIEVVRSNLLKRSSKRYYYAVDLISTY